MPNNVQIAGTPEKDTEHVKTHLPLSPVTGKLGNSQWAHEGNGVNQSPPKRRSKHTKPARVFYRSSSPVELMHSLKLPTHDEVHPRVTVDLRPKDRIQSNHASENLKKLLETPRHPPDPGFAMFGVNLSYRHIGDRPPPGLAEKLVNEMEKVHMQSFS
ncbi:hypothetical protein BS50DRAFT_626812 [Corynespora cassiicola Philippines]|uniref:Uncharacterized protein n=1 Tax=Corynespora cassiicola Philippines TaxID=1448308 RepID=A0A2T2N1W2_CORCC|nr:hypothetical protein BS50DRAFT_626812 [Corynespora cassiicola Philippines]